MSSCSLCALTSQDPFETHWLLRSASSAVTVPLSRNGDTNLGRWHLQALSPRVFLQEHFRQFNWSIKKLLKSEVRMNNRCLKLSDVACPNVPTHPQRIVDWHAADTCELLIDPGMQVGDGNSTTDGWIFGASLRGASGSKNRFSEHHCHLSRINQAWLDFSCSLCRVNLNSQGDIFEVLRCQMYMKIL